MNLQELGLSSYEEKAYLALIKHGKLSASHTSRYSEVPYGKIYEVLSSLESKGLVQVIPEKTKAFVATDPSNLSKLIDRREKELKDLKKEVEDLKKTYEHTEKEPVVIQKGKKNFYKIVRNLRTADEFSYAIKYTSEFNPEFLRNTKNNAKRGIAMKTLARNTPEFQDNLKKWKRATGTAGKEIENNGVAMGINEEETMIALTKQNVILLIRDKSLSEVLKQLVDVYHDHAKDIKV